MSQMILFVAPLSLNYFKDISAIENATITIIITHFTAIIICEHIHVVGGGTCPLSNRM